MIPLVIDTGKVLALDLDHRDRSIRNALTEVSPPPIPPPNHETNSPCFEQLKPIEGVASYSAPRFWPKDSASIIGTIHIQLAPSGVSLDPGGPHSSTRTTFARLDRVVERVDKLLRSRISGLEELTIQVEDSSHYSD